MYDEDHEREARPGQDVEVADRLPEEAGKPRDVDVREQRDAVRDRIVVVELDEEVAGYPDGEEVDRRPADDLVGPEVDGEVGIDEREQAADGHGDEKPDHPASTLVGPVDAPEGAHQHHPFEADVDHAAPLREEAAHRGEHERRREAERLGHEGGVERGAQVRRARVGGEDSQADPEHPGRHGAPAEPAPASGDRPDPEGDGDDAHQNRPDDRPRLDRRNGEERGERPEDDPEIAGRGGVTQTCADRVVEPCRPGAHGVAPRALLDRHRSFLRESQTERRRTSAPMKSTIRPWTM